MADVLLISRSDKWDCAEVRSQKESSEYHGSPFGSCSKQQHSDNTLIQQQTHDGGFDLFELLRASLPM
jgi:hypothetical protein